MRLKLKLLIAPNITMTSSRVILIRAVVMVVVVDMNLLHLIIAKRAPVTQRMSAAGVRHHRSVSA